MKYKMMSCPGNPSLEGVLYDVSADGYTLRDSASRSLNIADGPIGRTSFWPARITTISGSKLERVDEASASPTSGNPKQAYGDKKPPLHLIHSIALYHESAAMHSGRLKYGENNFIHTPVEIMTYIGAIQRHTAAYASGERVDAKELVHHLAAVRACCNILLSGEATGMLIDNRPVVGGASRLRLTTGIDYTSATASAFAEASSVVEHLNALYPQKVPA